MIRRLIKFLLSTILALVLLVLIGVGVLVIRFRHAESVGRNWCDARIADLHAGPANKPNLQPRIQMAPEDVVSGLMRPEMLHFTDGHFECTFGVTGSLFPKQFMFDSRVGHWERYD